MQRVETPARGAVLGLAAAALFGASTPLAKLLLSGFGPLSLSGLLYLGAGIALTIVRVFLEARHSRRSSEAQLRTQDWGLLAGIIFTGGILGPVLMLAGLGRLPGIATSLLLNLETPCTILIALVVFHEHLGGKQLLAALLIVIGAAILSYGPGTFALDGLGVAAVAAACLCWSVDNNLSQRLSVRDPVA